MPLQLKTSLLPEHSFYRLHGFKMASTSSAWIWNSERAIRTHTGWDNKARGRSSCHSPGVGGQPGRQEAVAGPARMLPASSCAPGSPGTTLCWEQGQVHGSCQQIQPLAPNETRKGHRLSSSRWWQSIAETQPRGAHLAQLSTSKHLRVCAEQTSLSGLCAPLLFAQHCFKVRLASLHHAKNPDNPATGSIPVLIHFQSRNSYSCLIQKPPCVYSNLWGSTVFGKQISPSLLNAVPTESQ